jgi:hypothetical protein
MLVAELDQQLSQFTVVSSLHARSAKPKKRSIHANWVRLWLSSQNFATG